jgi:hypothetical protein
MYEYAVSQALPLQYVRDLGKDPILVSMRSDQHAIRIARTLRRRIEPNHLTKKYSIFLIVLTTRHRVG